jgi:hypothetical protein
LYLQAFKISSLILFQYILEPLNRLSGRFLLCNKHLALERRQLEAEVDERNVARQQN